ncbi:MAG: hypothetical protein P8J80_01315 [Porticoccaceae bacterium]|nr:hypothetical protein [Porticoccaceae bacterium]
MRALAEFIMRGRAQACAVAFLGNLFPLISPATVGLVSLRKGSQEGVVVLLWAALPLIASYFFDQGSSLLTFISGLSLLMTLIAANVLRVTGSWQWTILTSMLTAMMVMFAIALLLSTDVDLLVDRLSTMFAELAQQQSAQVEPFIASRPLVLGLGALMLAVSTILCLFVSRWWQAMLYNPGGFGEEFRQLRLDVRAAGLSIMAFVVALYLPTEYRFWAELMVLPLLLSGLSLMHYGVNVAALGKAWLVFMYVGLVVSGPVIGGLLVGLGLADSLLNLRLKLTASKDREQ